MALRKYKAPAPITTKAFPDQPDLSINPKSGLGWRDMLCLNLLGLTARATAPLTKLIKDAQNAACKRMIQDL
ncbi:hypothetical protein JCM17844_15930 [Iodidimonas gelatinilytica]|uniref:Uncharacterized protein n=1 Tax=Iodidimonas gelatinilytica TaxID=1236966 RepID=A0A5A7MQ50_9PROT|nr:hypothetical protein JCM17844_15930 [Iodidimonas gelatinilytica]